LTVYIRNKGHYRGIERDRSAHGGGGKEKSKASRVNYIRGKSGNTRSEWEKGKGRGLGVPPIEGKELSTLLKGGSSIGVPFDLVVLRA